MRMHELKKPFLSCLPIRRASWPEGLRIIVRMDGQGIPQHAHMDDGNDFTALFTPTVDDFTAGDWELFSESLAPPAPAELSPAEAEVVRNFWERESIRAMVRGLILSRLYRTE